MDLRQLSHFVVLADELSFTRAAARLNLVQSALSVSIKNLEKDLKVVLFDRTTHEVALSHAGQALLPAAHRVLRDVEAARDAVAAVTGTVRGRIRVGLMQSLRLVDAAGLFGAFHRAHPDVVIEPRTAPGGATTLADGVRRGDLDLAFAWYAGIDPAIRAVELAREPLVLIAPAGRTLPSRRMTIQDLDGEVFVNLPQGWGARVLCDQAFHEAGLTRRSAVEVADTATCAELVRAGFGVALVPSSHIGPTKGLVTRAVSGLPPWNVSLLAPGHRPPTAAAAAFTDLVCAAFGVAHPA